MRRRISLYIDDKLVDLDEQSIILFNYTTEELDNPVIVKNSYSQQLTIPGTPNNNEIFGRYYRLDRITGEGYNVLKKLPFKIYDEMHQILVSGYVKLEGVKKQGKNHSFDISLYGSLGSFFYDLSIREDGTTSNLGDLAYKDASGTYVTPNEQTFALTAQNIYNFWRSLEEGKTGLLQSTWWNFFNFAPCLNGIPSDFDAKSALVTKGIFVGIEPVAGNDKSNPHPSSNDSYLVNMPTDKTESEVRDFRAYLQRPVINVTSFLDALVHRGGFSMGDDVLEHIGDLWVTLPLPRRTGSYATYPMKYFFEGSLTPADLLISLAKRFGLVFRATIEGIVLETRNEFYSGGELIDLQRRINRSTCDVSPINFSNKWYLWQDEVGGEFANSYMNDWGKVYGEQKVNTGYEFNSGSKVLTESLKTRGAVQMLDQSRMYAVSWGSLVYFPSAMFENISFQGFSSDGKESETIEVKQYLPAWANNVYYNATHHYSNVISMPQFQDKGGKGLDGGGVLLYFDSFVTLPSEQDRYLRPVILWRLTDDDTTLFNLLNGGVPCWDMRNSKGVTFAKIPHFSRWYGNGSLEFGTPLQLAEPLSSIPSETIYKRCWQKYITDRYDKDTCVVKCKVNLNGIPVGQALLRNMYWFDGCLWVLNAIRNYSLTTFDDVECEFVKVQDPAAYKEGQNPVTPPAPPVVGKITYISPSGTKNVNGDANNVDFVIATDPVGEEVSMSTSATWVSWDKDYNSLSIEKNPNTSVRAASLTFYLTNYPNDDKKYVTISQAAAITRGVTSVTPTSLVVEGVADHRDFTFVTEPAEASVKADIGDADWMSYDDSAHRLTWQENATKANRSAAITFFVDGHKDDYATKSVPVLQYPIKYIELAQDHVTMPHAGGTRLVGYETNGTLRTSVSIGSVVQVESVSGGIITLSAPQSEVIEPIDDIGTITVTVVEDPTKSATISVSQAGASGYIILDQEKVFANSLGGILDVTFRTDVAADRIGHEITGDGVTFRSITSTSIRFFLSPNPNHSAIDPKAVVRLYDIDRPRIETTLTIAQYGNISPE